MKRVSIIEIVWREVGGRVEGRRNRGWEIGREGCDIVSHFNDCLFGTLMYKKQASLFEYI